MAGPYQRHVMATWRTAIHRETGPEQRHCSFRQVRERIIGLHSVLTWLLQTMPGRGGIRCTRRAAGRWCPIVRLPGGQTCPSQAQQLPEWLPVQGRWQFFHFQDLLTRDGKIDFFLPFDDFKRHAAPATTPEYVTYRENVLEFIDKRNGRMAEWVMKHHPEIEVRQ